MNIDSELDKLTRIPWEKLTDEQKCSYALLAELYPERARLACDREIDELVAIPFEELTQDHCDRFFDIILIRNDIPDSILRRFEVRAAQLGGREVWGDIADPQSFFGARAWFEIRRVIAQQQASDDLYLPTLGKLIRAEPQT